MSARPASFAASLTRSDAARLRETARIVGWGLLIYAGVALIGGFLKANQTGAVAVQAVLVELGAGRLAIAWSDPHGPMPSMGAIVKRAAVGAEYAGAAVALVLGFALVSHAASRGHSSPAAWTLPIGLLVAGLTAMRDELLLRGIVLRAFDQEKTRWGVVPLLVCALAGAAAQIGVQLAHMQDEVAVSLFPALNAALLSITFAVLWRRDRGAWLAWGAHTAWLWAIGPVTHGGLLDIRWASGLWGNQDLLSSPATTIVLFVCALAAMALLRPREAASTRAAALH